MSWDSQETSIRYKPASGLMAGLVPRYAVGLYARHSRDWYRVTRTAKPCYWILDELGLKSGGTSGCYLQPYMADLRLSSRGSRPTLF
jgi:hypothetical protein